MNLQEEVRNGYTISAEMKKMWSIQMEMTQHLFDICKKYNLRIWADGGTLLGTVRHKGFIPWDDDIDLFMPRKDYDKLCSLADIEFKAPYFLQCYKTEKNYYRGHAQLRKDNTAAILNFDVFVPYHQGIFVDIFCYDNIADKDTPEFLQELQECASIKSKLNQYVYMKFNVDTYMIWLRPKYIYNLIKIFLHYFFHNPNKDFERMESMFRKYSETKTKYTNCPCFNVPNYRYTLRKQEWLKETIWMPFEDMLMPVPNGWHEIECTQYGSSYMKPAKAPSMHGGYLVIDTERSYKEYLPKLRAEAKKEIAARRKAQIKKLLHIVNYGRAKSQK